MCDILASSAANQGDNIVSVAQVPPWATETVLSPWSGADEARVSHMLSHVVWWKKKKKKNSAHWSYIYIKTKFKN